LISIVGSAQLRSHEIILKVFESQKCRSGVARMVRPVDSKYDEFAKHRILTRLYQVFKDYGDWSAMANAISLDRGVRFQRTNFNRIRNDTAGDDILDVVVNWLASKDENFKNCLKPESIFADVGISARDYYFHLFSAENLTDWDENLLTEFEGIYLCAPEFDANSYMPMPRVRELLIEKKPIPNNWQGQRSLDIKQYIAERSVIVLRCTNAFFYHAAEIPLGCLFPTKFQTLDIKSFYEGVGIASSNTIHVFLRECLSRVPKLHSILIKPKSEHQTFKFRGIDIYAPTAIKDIDAQFAMLTDDQVEHMKREMKIDNESDVFLRGSSQNNVSPLAWTKNRVDLIYNTDQVYQRKPVKLFDDPATHFIHPEVDISPQLEAVIDNPLLVGEFLGSRME